MKCKDCPIMKFDGENYSCPAHMHREYISMFTETECRAMEWYPKFLRDQIDTLINNILQLDEIMRKLWGMLTSYKHADGYQKLVTDDLKSVYDKYTNKHEIMSKESLRLQEELRRVEENVKTEKVPQERIHSTATEQQTDIPTGS